jgi:hypothetical protein
MFLSQGASTDCSTNIYTTDYGCSLFSVVNLPIVSCNPPCVYLLLILVSIKGHTCFKSNRDIPTAPISLNLLRSQENEGIKWRSNQLNQKPAKLKEKTTRNKYARAAQKKLERKKHSHRKTEHQRYSACRLNHLYKRKMFKG